MEVNVKIIREKLRNAIWKYGYCSNLTIDEIYDFVDTLPIKGNVDIIKNICVRILCLSDVEELCDRDMLTYDEELEELAYIIANECTYYMPILK